MRGNGWLLQWACLAIMLGALCAGVPRQAGPDEPAHAIRAAGLVRGQILGDPSDRGDAYRLFDVPSWVAQPDPGCFAFKPDQRAGCATTTSDSTSIDLASSAASYPPFAHILPGLPTLFIDSTRALWLSRLFGALFCSALVAGALHRLQRAGATTAGAATFLALTPAALFTMVVINPSGPTIAGTVAVVAALMCIRRTDMRSDLLLGAGASALALSRSDGWLWLVIVIALCSLLLRIKPSALWSSVGLATRIVVAVVAALSLLWSVLVRPQLVHVTTDLAGWSLVSAVLRRTTVHIDEAVGLFGWFDTSIPTLASYLWWAAFGGLAVTAYLDRCRRGLVVAATALIGFVVVGWLGDWLPADTVGLVWQGRYAIPLLVVGVCALGYRSGEVGRYPSPARAIGMCVTVVWNLAFYQALRRWSVGAHGSVWPLAWEKGGSAVHPFLCLVLFSLASCALWWINFGNSKETALLCAEPGISDRSG